MPIFKILSHDHKQLIKSMEDIVAFFSPPYFIESNKKLEEFFDIFNNLFFHYHTATNEICYPILLTSTYLESRILKAYQFHEIIQNSISQLRVCPAKNNVWEAKFMVMRDIFLMHLQEEDNVIFPVASELLSSIEKETLAEKILIQRSSLKLFFIKNILKCNH